MFSFNYRKSGWLKRYLLMRVSNRFAIPEAYKEASGEDFTEEIFDDCLYAEVKENGMLLGCPVISESKHKLAETLNFPKQEGATILLYLETLFAIAIIENECLSESNKNNSSITYQNRFLKIILLVLSFHLPGIYYRIPEDSPLEELLTKNETLEGALIKIEEALLKSVTLQGYSSLGNRQNNFAFSKLYFFLLWARSIETSEQTSVPAVFIEMDTRLREEMIITFAALIWADDYVDSAEQQVIEKYIVQTGLPDSKQSELILKIGQPVKIEEIHSTSNSRIINCYVLEQLILLSLINNQEAWQERELIEKIALQLELSEDNLENLYCTVADFFSAHKERLDFLKNNAAAQQFLDYMNDKVVKIVRKNIDNIMNEIKETKELSELLLKAATQPLTAEEKIKVQEQLLDVAKSIPALAVFALPGGGLLLPVLIKVLPFNILPSSFQDEPLSSH
ncbi:MAG: hypothetical protein H8E38_14205 [SAR324 cluster bacterium]|nr:hypothetical protein [SAR324 cluster bacterium]MBL7034874.1 hypothetical protein [SAR324 cluster bacterium]